MVRSFYSGALVFLVALFVLVSPVYSQTGQIRGTVMQVQPDGTKAPVADALVEAYNMEVESGAALTAKSNKKGEFALVAPVGRKYAIVVSGAGLAPTLTRNITAGMENLEFAVLAGTGAHYSEPEVRENLKKTASEKPLTDAERKKAEAEHNAKVKEVEEKNKKIQQSTDIINAALKAGNEAFNSKNYDLAVAKYTEGIEADPDFVGSAPILYKNKGVALSRIGVDTHNEAIKITDAAAKSAAQEKARKAFADSAESYSKGWNILKTAPASDVTDAARHEATKLEVLASAVETLRLASSTEKVDDRTIVVAKALIPEYLTIEKDAAKKNQANIILADMYRIKEDRESAVASYKKVLEASPDNVDALAYLGIVLVDLGWLKDNNTALMQEGANYLQKFVSVAPDTHKLKSGAVEYLEILKTQNVVPDKKGAAPKKKT